jgi:hypothetical protein
MRRGCLSRALDSEERNRHARGTRWAGYVRAAAPLAFRYGGGFRSLRRRDGEKEVPTPPAGLPIGPASATNRGPGLAGPRDAPQQPRWTVDHNGALPKPSDENATGAKRSGPPERIGRTCRCRGCPSSRRTVLSARTWTPARPDARVRGARAGDGVIVQGGRGPQAEACTDPREMRVGGRWTVWQDQGCRDA